MGVASSIWITDQINSSGLYSTKHFVSLIQVLSFKLSYIPGKNAVRNVYEKAYLLRVASLQDSNKMLYL